MEPTLQERNQINPAGAASAPGSVSALLAGLTGCGGSGDDYYPNASLERWSVAPNQALVLSQGSTFDLTSTLPSTAPRGGVFEIDRSGAPLPAGITLSPTGLLTVGPSATGGTAGVVFRYTPPA
jgi:hypothetical protein